ncbi:biotin--[acetyl-CoA-carboxylase] ligase [Acetonema longum]|uniref:Bifunctional ligase/repressor BirA n=1 Tax=Acetonema longum DSM 6540 TaxID=1009370 RepID=F7NMS6_9FIRM|nr:biotin--[acetyl-CoA-carboxylase] ligase [Acetonema longum]EGO62668.1 biotin/acetyl-CoA-carboxylase ligase [Acetonema longum DSM 6540]
MRTNILALLRRAAGGYISGEEISKQLEVSRTAVWKHIQALKDDGYEIESHPRLGYCLRRSPDILTPEEVRPLLKTALLGREIVYIASIDSTNNETKKLAAAGCVEGTILLTEEQHGGRGRLSRGWFSPFGKGIWLSVVLRPRFLPQEAPKCTLMTAVAVVKAIRKVTGIPCGIKWPNDILYQGKKLVGILTEMNAEMDAINHVVIGIGINVNIASEELPPDLAALATSLQIETGQPVSRRELLTVVLYELEQAYALVNTQGFDPILEQWRQLSVTLGQKVDVIGLNNRFSGVAVDIDRDGALLVDTPAGQERVIAGDVSIRPAGER